MNSTLSKIPSTIPGSSLNSPRRIISIFSHAAVWAGIYVLAAVVCLAQISGVDTLISIKLKLSSAAFAFCTAMGVYLLDRVKLRDAWLDPADAQANPPRYAFIAGHAMAVRALMAFLLATALCLAADTFAWAALLPALAIVGVLFYAARPRSTKPRPKDIVLLKNLYVALGITTFAALVALAAVKPTGGLRMMRHIALVHVIPLAIAALLLALRVLADAILCDLDDTDADRRFGTHTLPIHLGKDQAWNLALIIRLCSAAALMLIPILPFWPRIIWGVVTIASSLTLRWTSPNHVRDWVDARFGLEAIFVTLLLCCLR